MALKPVVVTIDTVIEILKHYCKPEDLPADAKPIALRVSPKDGRVEVKAQSEAWKEGLEPLEARFDIRRMYSQGGNA